MDTVNNNLSQSGLVRSLPRRLERNDYDRRSQGRGRDAYRRVDARKEPFTVKVSRKVNNAKERLTRRLGLYGAGHVFPLGMYVNYLA